MEEVLDYPGLFETWLYNDACVVHDWSHIKVKLEVVAEAEDRHPALGCQLVMHVAIQVTADMMLNGRLVTHYSGLAEVLGFDKSYNLSQAFAADVSYVFC